MSSTTAPSSRGPRDYETNPYYAVFDEYANAHLLNTPSVKPYESALSHALDHTASNGLQTIEVAPAAGKHLQLLIQLMILNRSIGTPNGSESTFNVLEVGTLAGYSSIWLASAHPSVRVTSIELDPHTTSVARANIAHAGLTERVQVIQGAALDVLAQVKSEVEKGTRPQFDFSFIDADKLNNWPYFETCRDVSKRGACIVVDNVVMNGTAVDPNIVNEDGTMKESTDLKLGRGEQSQWQHPTKVAAGNRRVIEELGKDRNVEGVLVQTVTGGHWDGILLAVKL